MADKAHSAGNPACNTNMPAHADSNQDSAPSLAPFAPAPNIMATLDRMLADAKTMADMDVFKHDFRAICHTLTQDEQYAVAGRTAVRVFQILQHADTEARS